MTLLSRLTKEWDDQKMVAFDFETSGTKEEYAIQPWRIATNDFWATSVSLIRHTGERLAPDCSSTLLAGVGKSLIAARIREMLTCIIENDWTVITWFGTFDISVCVAYGCGDLVHKVRWIDGMLLWRHLFVEPEYEMDRGKKKSYSLKVAVPEFLPVEHHGYEKEINFHATDEASLQLLHHYNNRDSVYTWILAKIFWTELTPQQRNCAMIESEVLSLVAEANFRGMPVDTVVTRELAAKLDKTAADMLEKLAPHGVTEKIVRSPTQLGKLMFDDWKLPVLKENTGAKTGKVSRATDKEVLHELAFVDDRCRDLRAYREALNNKTKFAQAPLTSAEYNGDGHTRPSAIVFGTYSGRMTYASQQGKGVNMKQTGFAIHQEKRGKDFRSIIIAPPGFSLLEVDASGQEFKWMAIKSGDPNMLTLCEDGEDPHSFMGASIISTDYRELIARVKAEEKEAEQTRYLGKVANFSLAYRTYPKTFRRMARVDYNIPLEIDEAKRIHRIYQQKYVKVPVYWDQQIQMVKQLGYAETMAGRRVQVTGDWEGKLAWKMQSTAINYPIQGTGGDQKYLAFLILKDYILGIGGYFAWDLHDGLYWWIPTAKLETAARDARLLLLNLPYREAWGFTPPIPLPWDAKIGPGWGGLREWKG